MIPSVLTESVLGQVLSISKEFEKFLKHYIFLLFLIILCKLSGEGREFTRFFPGIRKACGVCGHEDRGLLFLEGRGPSSLVATVAASSSATTKRGPPIPAQTRIMNAPG